MSEVKNKGWTVTLAGLGINLALGILYTYSIFKEAISASIKAHDGRFTWDLANLNDPYAVCCLMFAFAMIFAGRVQDKLGPRLTAVIGGILTGLGLMWVSLSYSLVTWVLGFGVLMGSGLGFGYASATPPAIKWFSPSKTGMIAGIVVAGFGLASVYIAPLSEFLIARFGLSSSMMIFGAGFLVVVCTLAQFLVNPPAGYKPEGMPAVPKPAAGGPTYVVDFQPAEVMRTGAFYKLWIMFAIGSGAGLMIIGNVAGMAKQSLGAMAWIVVALMAVGNAGGRVVAGMLSDKIGRMRTVTIMMTAQAAIMVALLILGSANALFMVLAASFVGFNYGTNLSLFPTSTKDFFGMKNFGANYGLVFTAWGVGGFILPKASQMIVAATGTFNAAYLTAAVLLLVSAGISLMTKAPQKVLVPLKAQFAPPAQAGVTGPFFTHMLKQQASKEPK
ncbi:MAG: OFA family MFS transporter [Desulfarculus sp.]|nr:OFA family MFS transporter [Desulfarculus sp.]